MVCVKFANVLYRYMQFIGIWVGKHRGIGCGGNIGLGVLAHSRVQALTGFLHVDTEGISRSRAVLAGVMVSETRPLLLVSGFESGLPGGLDGKYRGGV